MRVAVCAVTLWTAIGLSVVSHASPKEPSPLAAPTLPNAGIWQFVSAPAMQGNVPGVWLLNTQTGALFYCELFTGAPSCHAASFVRGEAKT